MNPFLTDDEIAVALATSTGNLSSLIVPGTSARVSSEHLKRDTASAAVQRRGAVDQSVAAICAALPDAPRRDIRRNGVPVSGAVAVLWGGPRKRQPVLLAAWCEGEDPTIHLHGTALEGMFKHRAATYLVQDLTKRLSTR